MGGGYNIYSNHRDGDESENIILSILLSKFNIKTMVDFGCATGRWCKAGKELGMTEVLGIDGEYVNVEALVIDKTEFRSENLENYINLSQRYDLAISLEVAEHIPENKSDIFVENLVNAADLILFSAAVPGQGGDFHVNEQLMSYWVEKFERHGYLLYDCIRPEVWKNKNVMSMYRQNCVIFAKNILGNVDTRTGIVDIIHPDVFNNMSKRGVMLFPFHRVEKSSKVVLYGAGIVGNMYYRQLMMTEYCREIIWVDAQRTQACVNNATVSVCSLDTLGQTDAEYYVIAIENDEVAKNVIDDLKDKWNINGKKIIYEKIPITRY